MALSGLGFGVHSLAFVSYIYTVKQAFLQNINSLGLFDRKHKLLVAISGGMDSTVLAHLLRECGYSFALAHCNFKLRAKESDGDELFCEKLAQELGAEFYTISFDTKKYAVASRQSIQMAARELRYEWFDKLLSEKKFDYLLTAHHASDQVETILINLIRGTGSRGMKGILPKNKNTVRPLLHFTREQIETYAKKNKLRYRKDSSNSDDKYERNFLRLHVIPRLKKLNPSLEETFMRNAGHAAQEQSIVEEQLRLRAKKIFVKNKEAIIARADDILKVPYASSLLHHVLGPLLFSATHIDNILRALQKDNSTGKTFESGTHLMLIDRGKLILTQKQKHSTANVLIADREALFNTPHLNVEVLKKFSLPKKQELIIRETRLVYPLSFRQAGTGDRFQPFGMKHSKLVSDFFREQKLSMLDKQNKRLLVNGNGDILWIAGMRSDERYRVKETETGLLKLKFER